MRSAGSDVRRDSSTGGPRHQTRPAVGASRARSAKHGSRCSHRWSQRCWSTPSRSRKPPQQWARRAA